MMKNRRCKTVLAVAAAAVFLLSVSAVANAIQIVNPSFENPENPVLAPDDWTWSEDCTEPGCNTPTPGWAKVGADGHGARGRGPRGDEGDRREGAADTAHDTHGAGQKTPPAIVHIADTHKLVTASGEPLPRQSSGTAPLKPRNAAA